MNAPTTPCLPIEPAAPRARRSRQATVKWGANVVTVGDVLAQNNVTLAAGQTVSIDGNVVNLDHEIDTSDPSAVHVVLVVPRVNNG